MVCEHCGHQNLEVVNAKRNYGAVTHVEKKCRCKRCSKTMLVYTISEHDFKLLKMAIDNHAKLDRMMKI